jgi:hypothetical protein
VHAQITELLRMLNIVLPNGIELGPSLGGAS